jgi:hypothetical protein
MLGKRKLFVSASLLVSAMVWGCGSSGTGGTDVSAPPGPGDVRTVGINNCAICHGASPKTRDWLESRHANQDNQRPNTTAMECLVCHDQLNDGLRMEQAFGVLYPDVVDANVVSCESCHGGGSAHRGIGPIPFPIPGPGQCGQCHGIEEALFHGPGQGLPATNRIINDTHFDNPATASTEEGIEGYVVNTADQRGCQVCHFDGHRLNLDRNLEWARSAHGGRILDAKDAATTDEERIAAPVTSATGDAWLHYNWDQTTGTGNRASCQRCHTATGVANFLTDSTAYDPANNDFSYLAGWTPETGSPQNEMLYCWGCHTGEGTSALRNPGELTLDFEFLEGPEQTPGGERTFVVLPDKGQSNVCGACHSGRGNDTSIRDSYAAAAARQDPPRSLSPRFAGHHAPTAGSLYAEVVHTGFEFAGRDYTPEDFVHDDIEISGASPETGDGPCVACHMAGAVDHTFEAVDRNGAGVITAIKNQTLCDTCHGGAVNAAFLNTRKAGFEAARAVLNDYVRNTRPNYLDLEITAASGNLTTDILSLNDYGAFQNSTYMLEEPCIYVHNRIYARRLIFDSIDWLDNGELNGTISISGPAATWLGTTRP